MNEREKAAIALAKEGGHYIVVHDEAYGGNEFVTVTASIVVTNHAIDDYLKENESRDIPDWKYAEMAERRHES